MTTYLINLLLDIKGIFRNLEGKNHICVIGYFTQKITLLFHRLNVSHQH